MQGNTGEYRAAEWADVKAPHIFAGRFYAICPCSPSESPGRLGWTFKGPRSLSELICSPSSQLALALIAPPRQASARSPHPQMPILKQKLMGYPQKNGDILRR